jgi:hypothetical protein
MSFIQRFFLAIFPKHWGEAMERSSRRWMFQCQKCQAEWSFWDAGGIRWAAVSKGKRTYVKCPKCGKRSWTKVFYAGADRDVELDDSPKRLT